MAQRTRPRNWASVGGFRELPRKQGSAFDAIRKWESFGDGHLSTPELGDGGPSEAPAVLSQDAASAHISREGRVLGGLPLGQGARLVCVWRRSQSGLASALTLRGCRVAWSDVGIL